jgi:hypothetical protein
MILEIEDIRILLYELKEQRHFHFNNTIFLFFFSAKPSIFSTAVDIQNHWFDLKVIDFAGLSSKTRVTTFFGSIWGALSTGSFDSRQWL